jgi:hypothetical protein
MTEYGFSFSRNEIPGKSRAWHGHYYLIGFRMHRLRHSFLNEELAHRIMLAQSETERLAAGVAQVLAA